MADFILAAKRGILSKVLSELREGVPVDYQDEEQATALYWACCSGHDEICQLLLDNGANANLPVKWGSTALHAAADRGHIKCIRLLLRYRAFVNAVNSSGDTALHLAAYRGRREVCMLLVGHQADLSIVNRKGKTPQREAQAGEHREIAILLAEKKTDHRPRSFPQQQSEKEQISYSAPLTTNQLTDWDRAQRSASYPLDHSVNTANGHKSDTNRSGSDELRRPSAEDVKRSSLRRELLQPVNTRLGVQNIPYMNQLSQEDRHNFHLQHRPHSDTTAVLHRDMPNVHTIRVQSDPTKHGNPCILDEVQFQRKQQETERQLHAKTVEELQVQIALLGSQNEALLKRLHEHKSRPTSNEEAKLQPYLDEEGKRKLEVRVKDLMSEVQQERRERSEVDAKSKELVLEIEQERREKNEADARSRQLASELFQLKSVTKLTSLEKPKDGSLQLARPEGFVQQGPAVNSDHRGSQRNFALKFCHSSNRSFLNSSTDLEQVLATILQNQGKDCSNSMTSLKTTTCQKLETIATEMSKCSDVTLSVEPGKAWEREKDYTFVDSKPIDSQLRRKEDGLATEVVFRIEHQSKMAAMKMILDHGRAPSLSNDANYGSEWEILTTLSPHSNITRILHWYSQPVTNIKDLIESSLNTSLGPLPDNVAILVHPEYRLSLDILGSECSPVQAIGERCILRILLELLKAVHYLKNNGIVHRDIEPSKIFIDQHLRIVLGEFGLARRIVNESNQPIPFVEKSQIMAGNALAWSPELMRYNSEGPPKSYQKSLSLVDVYDASDMFAIATTLCHMINQTPQDEKSAPGIIPRSLPPSQPQVPGVLSLELQALLTAMLQENPRDRPTSQEAILRVSMMLFGPRRENIKTQSDCEAWIQAQLLRLLAMVPTVQNSDTVEEGENLDELAKAVEWTLCYEYVTNVTALQLWELGQDTSQ